MTYILGLKYYNVIPSHFYHASACVGNPEHVIDPESDMVLPISVRPSVCTYVRTVVKVDWGRREPEREIEAPQAANRDGALSKRNASPEFGEQAERRSGPFRPTLTTAYVRPCIVFRLILQVGPLRSYHFDVERPTLSP